MTNAFRMSGLVPATFTPMHADGSLNLGVVPAMVERLIAFRSNALFVCGTLESLDRFQREFQSSPVAGRRAT